MIKRIPKLQVLKVILVIFFFISITLPLISMFFFIDGKDFSVVFKKDSFFSLLRNSLLYTSITVLLVLLTSLVAAYSLHISKIKHKSIFVLLLTIPMLIPSVSHGLGIINIFGNNGFLDKLLGIRLDAYGLLGLILGSFIYSFPVAFLMFYDSMNYLDFTCYEVASVFGETKIKMFFKLLLPQLKVTIVSVVLTVFTMVFTDYGVPLAVGGDVQTLPMYLYNEVINRLNFSKGIIVGISLLIPAVVAFLYDLFKKKEINIESTSNNYSATNLTRIFTKIYLVILIVFLLSPILSFAIIGFVESFPNDMSLSLDHLVEVINGELFAYLGNSLIIAGLTAIIGTIIAYFTAYLTTRTSSKTGKVLHFITISSMAIPGIILGLSYIFIFKNTFIYGTIIILILVNIIHFIGSPYLMIKNAMIKIDENYEIIGSTLGVSRFKIFKDVILPSTKITIIEMLSYFFINSMITISAVSFLASIFDMPLALLIPIYEAQLSYSAAAIVSLAILVVNIIFKMLMVYVKKYFQRRGGYNAI